MTMTETGLSYRKSAIEGASPIGLMIALFDTLVGDFRRASTALRKNDIETRCRELNHATLVLGQLENWLDMKNGDESAATLGRFYAYLRAKMMQAAVTQSATLLEAQIDMILHVRSAWQQLDNAAPTPPEGQIETSAPQPRMSYPSAQEPDFERVRFSQSA
ncbi:MAG: flagellar export chaperone FliS [Terracidiphilus sp.]